MSLVNRALRASTTISSSNGQYRKRIHRWMMRRSIKVWRTWWKKPVIVFSLINLSFWKCHKNPNRRALINECMWSDNGIVIVVVVTRAARVLRWTVCLCITYSRNEPFRIKRKRKKNRQVRPQRNFKLRSPNYVLEKQVSSLILFERFLTSN